MLQAIIFDMDGVIVDTEYVEFNAQREFIERLKQHNQPITLAQQSEVVGKSLKDIPAVIKKLSGSSLSLDEIREQYYLFWDELFERLDYRAIFREEISNIIQFAQQQQIKLAVASSSSQQHIERILMTCGIKDVFDCIVSGEMFVRSKPDPEIYRYTLDKLGVAAENAVAIEDSFYGMQAAKTAGLTVIGYEEKRMLIDQSLADYMGKDMQEILGIICQLHQ
ncbi:HAD family hydrolase [Gallibacterium genomosp. 3]|uniref:phosphoglycolate phosphatase n=1 Tax=Gallibacterium genomosp. 3 TaxID=505345 RepID=A0A1A7QBK6_9PAST|nr:HAD family phosphatase [Gallibacterium genomosp. 3]OBX10790.1 phosphatase [Gallibacterium genomosp. 3]